MAIQSNYNKPDVSIIQQVVNPSVALADPDLYPCIIGPAYRIVRDSSAGMYDGSATSYNYPSKESTDEVDTDSIVVKAVNGNKTFVLDSSNYSVDSTSVSLNASIQVEYDLDNAIGSNGDSTSNSIFTDSSAKFITWGVEAGDKLSITSGSDSGTYLISSVDSETKITLSTSLGHTASNLDYKIIKVLSIGSGLGSKITISYRALRKDLTSGTIEYRDASSIFGIYDTPDNPLGYGVYLALLNTLTKVKYVATDGTSQSDFVNALNSIETEEVYTIALLSQDTSLVPILKSHCENMSAYQEKRERIALANIPLSLRAVRLNTTDATIVADSGDIYIMNRPGAQFLSNGVLNGDRVYFETVTEYQSAPSTSYVVREVTSEDSIKIESSTDITGVESLITISSQDFSRSEQAQHIRDYASSIESKRIVLTWPDVIQVNPDGTSRTVPGYYINCALAGMISSLPAQQPMTTLGVVGISNLTHSNLGYFKFSDLDDMASGGVMIFEQSTHNATPQIRHQLTTDMTIIENRELSIVKNVDFIAKYLRERVRPFIGEWNITENFLDMLEVTLQSAFEDLKETDGRAGPNIISATIASIEQNESNPDRVDIIVDLEIPYPANDIRITLRI